MENFKQRLNEEEKAMKSVLKKAALIMMSVLMAGCGAEKNAEQNVEQATEDDVLKIGVLNIADSAVMFAAEKDNLFEEYNANVELVKFGSASDQSKAVEAGEIDGIMTDMIVQGLINKSEDCHLKSVLVALGDKVENGKFIIAAAPGNEHNTIETLPGAKIAISEGTSMEFLLDSYCEVLGIDLASIEKVNVPNIALRMEMLLEGSDIGAALFVIQMKQVHTFGPNWATHPQFGQALADAQAAGVELWAMDCIVTPDSMALDKPVPIDLSRP